MNKEIYTYLRTRPELINFIRHNPEWYRYLSRDPNRVSEIEMEAKRFYGKTISQKLEKVNQNVQMVGMLLQFAEMMKD
ncbi:YlbE-like family protein [Ornithinibacillus sp. 179-J 7C1 HS]|uniref:YlbE-like family protein n=1 Tax=Ornithinibacillus sp. 179-J 7C1 HS TaxID=3142384 RepID=UPI00399F6E41